MNRSKLWLAAAALCAATLASAAPQAVVEAVQFPAWLERGGRAVPLVPGSELLPRDVVRTGEGARAQLRLAEGSLVKLGAQASFTIERSESSAGGLRAALSVLAGAFRFTTDAINKAARRDVQVKVRNVTVGIRGTDLWGKSTPESDFVILLEGTITVGSAGHPTVTLTKPAEVYTKPVAADPTVGTMDMERIGAYAQETELSADGPVGRTSGTWRVIVAIYPDRDSALALNRAIRAAGYPSEVAGLDDGRTSVQLKGFGSEGEARAAMANLRAIRGVNTPSVRQGR